MVVLSVTLPAQYLPAVSLPPMHPKPPRGDSEASVPSSAITFGRRFRHDRKIKGRSCRFCPSPSTFSSTSSFYLLSLPQT